MRFVSLVPFFLVRSFLYCSLAILLNAAPQQGVPTGVTQNLPIPSVLHFCALHCTTLVWDRNHFTGAFDPGGSIWVVDSFTRDSVVIRRVDRRPRPYNAVYRATFSTEGNTINGNGFKFTWGTALNSIPGSGDPDRRIFTPQAPSSSNRTAPAPAQNPLAVKASSPAPAPSCNDRGQLPANSERAVDLAKQAALGRNDAPAFACFLFAAQQGNASAQVDTAYAFEKGVGTGADLAEARRWYLAAAEQGNTAAQSMLIDFYEKGRGGPPDKAEADRWTKMMWETRNRHSSICGKQPIKDTIKLVEWDSVKDGGGMLLGALAAAVTGVRADMANSKPALKASQGSDMLQQYGRFHIDLGMASDDFICQTIFARGPFKDCDDKNPRHEGMAICIQEDGESKPLTADQAKAAFDRFPQFREMFRARPLPDGRYQITLVPTSLQLASVYSRTTTDPVN
jgi:hypothetical protein